MASLREIKSQINSVKSTQQITSAMQMVSTVKLQQAQKEVENFRPYQKNISDLLLNLLESKEVAQSIFEEVREIKKIAIVVFASNMSLCGSFNSNVAKEFLQTIDDMKYLGEQNILIYSIGKKITQFIKKIGYTPTSSFETIANKPKYEDTIYIADELMNLFENAEIDKVIFIYHHFVSKGTQLLIKEDYLPFLPKKNFNKINSKIEYIVEPNEGDILQELVPKVLRLKLYKSLLESYTSEQAARSMAMQAATDNADDLLDDLSLSYNKSRQQSITNELLDIIGATFK